MKVGQPIVDIAQEPGTAQPKLGNSGSEIIDHKKHASTPSSHSLGDAHRLEPGHGMGLGSRSSHSREVHAAPAVRKLAKESGVDLRSIVATG
jgi:pyruvate/2-oxoglutarate dehydrogenase complex dihydrolipoamide acyltransferase (E2) component